MPLENYKIYTIEELEILRNEPALNKLINEKKEEINKLEAELKTLRSQKKWFSLFSKNIDQQIKTLEITIKIYNEEITNYKNEYESFKISSVERLEKDLTTSQSNLNKQIEEIKNNSFDDSTISNNPFDGNGLEEFDNNCEKNKENQKLNQELKKCENEYQNLKNDKDQLEENKKELAAELKTTYFFLFWKKWKIKKEININNQKIKANDQKIIENEEKVKNIKFRKYVVLQEIIEMIKTSYKNNLSYLNKKQNEKIDTLTNENVKLKTELLAFKEKKTNDPECGEMLSAKDQEICNFLNNKNPKKNTNPFDEEETDVSSLAIAEQQNLEFAEGVNNLDLNSSTNSAVTSQSGTL